MTQKAEGGQPPGKAPGRSRAEAWSLSAFWTDLVACRGDLARVLDLIVRRTAEVVGEGAVLTTLSEDGEHLIPEATYHPDAELRRAMTETVGTAGYLIGEGIVGQVALDRRPAVVNGLAPDVIADLVPRPARAFVDQHPIRALLIVPMIASGELVGTLGVARFTSTEPYSRDDQVAVAAMAERAAIAIHQAQERPAVLGPAEYEALYRNGADGILFTSPDGKVLAANPAACRILALSERQICTLGRDGLLVADDPATRHAMEERARVGTVRAEVPMRRGNGALFTADITSTVFAAASGELRTCVIFRDVSQQATERDELLRRADALAAASRRDPLTDLYNRLGFFEVGAEALAIARRDGRTMQLAYLDVDDFKAINDTRGHAEGDAMLRHLARAITSVTREADVGARLGGDEFALLLFGAREAEATQIMRRLRSTLDEEIAPDTTPLEFSVGVVEFDPTSDESLERLVERADRQMYEMKARRRFDPRR